MFCLNVQNVALPSLAVIRRDICLFCIPLGINGGFRDVQPLVTLGPLCIPQHFVDAHFLKRICGHACDGKSQKPLEAHVEAKATLKAAVGMFERRD